jgi:hypothetical protein
MRGALVIGLFVGAGLLLSAGHLLAQRGGGAGMGGGAPVAGTNRPGGVDEKDDLRGFHHAMAVQATSEQIAAFRAVMKKTEAASREFDELVKNSDSDVSAHVTAVRTAIETARTDTGKFVSGFSEAQKTGLKEIAAKLMKAETELGEQAKILDSGGDAREEAARIAGRADGLRKALANFRNEQDGLAVEMGIVMSEGADEVAFTMPARKSSVTIGGQAIGLTTSAVVMRATGTDGLYTDGLYKVEATTDLSDLQDNFSGVLGAMIDRDERCGERIHVQQATLDPAIPLSTAMARLHYERWVCSTGYGGTREVSEGNATVNMKLTAGLDASGQAGISTELEQVQADRFFADLLKSGELGAQLRAKTSAAVMAALANVKTAVPGAEGATARSVRFVSPREGELSVVVGGEMRMSAEQAKEMEGLVKTGAVVVQTKAQ